MFNRKIWTISDKIHTPYEWMFWLWWAQWYEKEVTWTMYIDLTNAIADKLLELKAYGWTEQRNLPSWYTQVEYLESSGTQYIDTGIVLNSVATIEMVAQLNTSSVTGVTSFWGFIGPSSSGSIPRWTTAIYGNKWLMDLNITQWDYSNADTNKHTFVNSSFYNNNDLCYQATIDGVDVFQSAQVVIDPEAYGTNTLKAYLFARNNGSGVTSYVNGKIYQFKITQNDILVINLIPCKRNSDNVLGMYDTVTGNFLTNSGTGTFTAGSETVPTPDYPMDIWCNNGILKVSPNLFNKSLVPDANEYINRSNGNVSAPASGEFRHSDYIVIKENTQYYVGIITSTASSAGLAFYDDTKTYLSGISLTELGNNNNIITSPADTKYIRFSFRTDEGYNTNWQNTVYFVEGNQPLTEFMPYGQIYTDGTTETITDSLGNTASAEMLLSVGDYKDTQEVLSGAVTRNIGIKVLDGTENWTKATAGGTYREQLTISDAMRISGRNDIPITHFHYNATSNDEGVGFMSNSTLYLYANVDWTNDQFKQWLADQYNAGTPVIIVYPLATATTESVAWQTMNIQTGTNTIEITQASIDSLQLYAKYKSSHQ